VWRAYISLHSFIKCGGEHSSWLFCCFFLFIITSLSLCRKKVKSRYCVLTNTEIAVFKSMDVFLHQGESSVKMLIPIDAYTSVRPATSTNKIDKRNSFVVQPTSSTPMKEYELNADSQQDALKWIHAIENAKSHGSGETGGGGGGGGGGRGEPQQPRFAPPNLAPAHVQPHAPALPSVPRGGGGGAVNGRSSRSGSSATGMMVIPPGIDPDQFLSLPKDIQEQILRDPDQFLRR
jgi:hypothetical protein